MSTPLILALVALAFFAIVIGACLIAENRKR